MENNTKRKKRKTRKRLDELRKRSRIRKSAAPIPETWKLNQPRIDIIKKNKNIDCISSERLTLKKFKKAVISDTITRPEICDKKRDYLPLEMLPLNIVDNKKHDISGYVCNNHTDFLISKECGYDENQEEPYPDGLCDPTSKLEYSNLQNSDDDATLKPLSFTNISNEEYFYHLYHKFIDDIPFYIRKKIPKFLKHNVMRKTKTRLHKLYVEKNCQSNEHIQMDSSLRIDLTSMSADDSCNKLPKILEDPMDYIKASQQQKCQSFKYQCRTPDSSISQLSSPALYSPLMAVQLPSVVSYTPTYDFYPHRLNE